MPQVIRRRGPLWGAAYAAYALAFAALVLFPAGYMWKAVRGSSEVMAFSASPESRLGAASPYRSLVVFLDNNGIRPKRAPWKPTGMDYGNTNVPMQARDGYVCLAWQLNVKPLEAVPPGANVLAPRWFFVESDDGAAVVTDPASRVNSKDRVSSWDPAQYVQTAHDGGAEVWAQVMSFTPKLSKQIVTDRERRDEFVGRIASWVRQYGLDGIDFDFENMDPKDAAQFTELVAACKQALPPGAKVCVDVTVPLKNPSPTNWYQCYDREGLGRAADYIAIMAYQYVDMGPVAGIGWDRSVVRLTLGSVPSEKVLLGIPFYGNCLQIEDLPQGVKYTEFPDIKKSTSHWNVFPYSIQSLLENEYYMSGTKKIEVDYWIERGVWDDKEAVTRYSFIDIHGYLNLIYIDDERSLQVKGGLAVYERLGGVAVMRMDYGEDRLWNALCGGIESPPDIMR
jgi:spore germination protein YaaH